MGDVIAAICVRLDHLPLAIELAAARTRLLPPARLLDQLDAPLTTVVGGLPDAPERQRTLRQTIAWSHDLLDPPARAAVGVRRRLDVRGRRRPRRDG